METMRVPGTDVWRSFYGMIEWKTKQAKISEPENFLD